MKIYKIAANDEYEKFKEYLLHNLYMWHQLPTNIKGNKKLWDRFLREHPQFHNQIGSPGTNGEIDKKLIEKWKRFILSNPDLMKFCPIESLKTDSVFLREIHDFWVKELIESPYTWWNLPEYVFDNKLIWEDVFKIKPSYRNFKPSWKSWTSFNEG